MLGIMETEGLKELLMSIPEVPVNHHRQYLFSKDLVGNEGNTVLNHSRGLCAGNTCLVPLEAFEKAGILCPLTLVHILGDLPDLDKANLSMFSVD